MRVRYEWIPSDKSGEAEDNRTLEVEYVPRVGDTVAIYDPGLVVHGKAEAVEIRHIALVEEPGQIGAPRYVEIAVVFVERSTYDDKYRLEVPPWLDRERAAAGGPPVNAG